MIVVTILGMVIMTIGSIWMLVEQFKSGILWGLGCLLVPCVSLIWLVTHWEDGARPFLVSLVGMALFIGGSLAGAPLFE